MAETNAVRIRRPRFKKETWAAAQAAYVSTLSDEEKVPDSIPATYEVSHPPYSGYVIASFSNLTFPEKPCIEQFQLSDSDQHLFPSSLPAAALSLLIDGLITNWRPTACILAPWGQASPKFTVIWELESYKQENKRRLCNPRVIRIVN